jgi:hypothetical protein
MVDLPVFSGGLIDQGLVPVFAHPGGAASGVDRGSLPDAGGNLAFDCPHTARVASCAEERTGVVVGFMSEQQINTQLRKAQGETNTRLEQLIAEQRRTNELLERLLAALPPAGART